MTKSPKTCKTCAWRSYNIVQSEFLRAAYKCLNDDSTKYKKLVSMRQTCARYEHEPERLAS